MDHENRYMCQHIRFWVLVALSNNLGKCTEPSEPSLLTCIQDPAVIFTDNET